MRSWPRKFAAACGTISLLASLPAAAQTAGARAPAVALLDSSDLAQWQTWTKGTGWQVVAPAVPATAAIDERVQAVEKAVAEAVQNHSVDPLRVYLAGRGEAAAAVFYAVSRAPDLWAAAAALGGSPDPAINSGLLYAANFTNVPVLWIGSGANAATSAQKLRSAGVPLEWHDSTTANIGEVLEWLGRHTRSDSSDTIDCETSSPAFARCYWIQMTQFDAAERNDVLDSTRISPPNLAALDLGGFGFKPDDPGPGLLVSYLPEHYSGKLKLDDRILELDGRDIPDASHYAQIMAQITDEKPAVIMVQRGKDHIRIETRILVPHRPVSVTARVQGRHSSAEDEVQIVSRMVTAMRVTIPAHWTPVTLNWNGLALEKVETPGCYLLSIDKGLMKAAPCP